VYASGTPILFTPCKAGFEGLGLVNENSTITDIPSIMPETKVAAVRVSLVFFMMIIGLRLNIFWLFSV
jgi:hypothetical protein